MQISWLFGLLALAEHAQAAKKATGPQDDVVNACTAFLSKSFTYPFCKGVNKKKTAPCYCAQPDWLESTLSCIQSLDSEAELSEHFSALKKYCKAANTTMAQIKDAASKVDTLTPLGTPFNSYTPRKAKGAFSLPRSEYELAFRAYEANDNFQQKTWYYGVGLMCFWYGVVLLRSILHWTRNIFPTIPHKVDSKAVRWLRKNILVPPLVHFKHSTPATLGNSRIGRFFTFNLPTRQSALIVLCYAAVNLALCFSSLDIVPYNYNFTDWSDQYDHRLGVRTGWMVVFSLPVLFLFAGRNNFMIQMTGWPLDEFNVFHKWVGRMTLVDVLIHLASYSYVRIHGGRYSSMWSTPYWQYGVAAAFMGGALGFFGMHWFRKVNYEFFLILHIVCAVGFIVAGYYHVKIIADELRVFYAVWAIWAFDRTARLGRVLVASPFSRATVTYHNGHTVELTITYSKLWKVPPGSYIFVHVIQPAFFWESHPFTVMQGVRDDHQGCIKLYCRGLDGMTRRMVEKCQRNDGSFETYVWLDGPYHQYINTSGFKEALFIAGGIGITAPFSYVQGHISRGFKDITVHWGIRDSTPLEWFSNEIEYMLQHGVKLHIHVGDGTPVSSSNASFATDKEKTAVTTSGEAHVTEGQMDISRIITGAAQNAGGPLAVLCCGPGPVNDLSRQAVVANLMTSPHYIEYFEESFSW